MKIYPYAIDNGHLEQVTFTGITHGVDGDRLVGEGCAQPGAAAPMHVHYLQDETFRVIAGRLGHQVMGQGPRVSGPGEVVVWPAGTAHKWWNAGDGELLTEGVIAPPLNYEFFLSTIFASAKQHGGRPGIFDAAFVVTRYRTEHGMVEVSAFVRRFILPMVCLVGRAFGEYRKYKDAPRAIAVASRVSGVTPMTPNAA